MSNWLKRPPQQMPFMPQALQQPQQQMPLMPMMPQQRQGPPVMQPPQVPVEKGAKQPAPMQLPMQSMSMSMQSPMMPLNLSPEEKQNIESSRERLQMLMDRQANRQQGAIAQMQQNLQEYKQKPRGMDWSPALAFIDFLNKGKSNLAATYNQSSLRPESERAKMANIVNMQNQIASQQDRAAGNEIQLAKAHMQSLKDRTSMASQLRYFSRLRGQDKTDARFWARESHNAQKEVMKFTTKMTDEAGEKAQQFNQMDEAFSNNDYQSVMSNLSVFARAVSGERGVLTDKDIERVIPPNFQGGVAKFLSSFSNIPTSELPPGFTTKLRQLIDVAKRKSRKRYKDAIDSHQENANTLPYYNNIKEHTDKLYSKQRDAITSSFQNTIGDEKDSVDLYKNFKKSRGE
jgi:hypothetical protein